jgi:peroxiredoxin
MINIGSEAPDFTLEDQFGQKFNLGSEKGRHHVLLLFYPLDWTPT